MMVGSVTSLSPSFITAIESLKPVARHENQAQEAQQSGSGVTFTDMLKQLIDNANATSAQTKSDANNLALGLIDDAYLHNIMINAEKADLALRTFTSVRNKVMDAYTEVMRITL